MSSTNCLRPSSGFCLNLRVRIVNSTMLDPEDRSPHYLYFRGAFQLKTLRAL